MIPDNQARNALQSGGVLKPADKDPHSPEFIQLASWLGEIGKGIIKGGSKEVVTDAGGDLIKGAVPIPTTERLMEPGTTYTGRQKKLEESVLSKKGLERFQAGGRDANIATTLPSDEGLGDALSTIAKTSDETITSAATKKTGLANEGDALDVLEMTKKDNILVSTDEGIDFNFDKMESGEDVLATINAVSEIIKKPTDVAKRGKIPLNETYDQAEQLLADEIGFTKRVLKMKKGTTLNAEEMTALRIVLQNSGKKLTELARLIEKGEDSTANLLKFRRLMAIHSGLQMKAKGAQTEIARALNAFKIPVGARDDVSAAQAAEILLNESGGNAQAKKLAAGYIKALNEGGQSNANKYVYDGWDSKFKGVFHEIYINGLLAYPKTHFKNFFATPLFMVYNQFVDATAATVGTMKGLVGKRDPEGIFYGDIWARWYGMNQSYYDAFVTAYKTFRDEDPADALNKVEAQQFKAIDSENLRISGTMGQAVDWFGKMIRYPGRALMAADDFWRVIASRGVLYEEAYRKTRIGLMNGLDEQTAIDNGTMVLLDPRSVQDKMDAASTYATLTEDLGDGGIAKITRAMQQNFFGRIILPFAKAPTNAIRMVMQGHPLAALASKQTRADIMGQNGAQAAQRARARIAFGSGTMSAVFLLAQTGRLTGALPQDQNLRNQLPKGWQPYSFVFRGENFPVDSNGEPLPLYDRNGVPNGELLYINYSGLEPVSAFFGIAADTAEKMRRFDDPTERMGFFSASLFATTDYFKNVPFLQGMSEIITAFKFDNADIILKSPMSNIYGVAPMPYSAIVRNVDKLMDPTIKTPSQPLEYYTIEDARKMFDDSKKTNNPLEYVPYEIVGTVKDSAGTSAQFWKENFEDIWLMQNKTNPWFEERKDDYQYRYDVLGYKVETSVPYSVNPVKALWNSLTPFKMSRSEAVPEWHKTIIRLGVPLSIEKKSMEGIALPKAFRGDLNELAKNEIEIPVAQGMESLTFRKHLELLMSSIAFKTAPRSDQIGMIRTAERKFYEAAFLQLMRMDEHSDILSAYSARQRLKEVGVF